MGRRPQRLCAWTAAVAGVGLPPLLMLLVGSGMELGVPELWSWRRLPRLEPDPVGTALILGGAALALVAALGRGFRRRKWQRAGWLLLGGLLFDCGILLSGRAGAAENALGFLDPFTTGYLTQAARHCADGSLRTYCREELYQVGEGEYPHHLQVHPPGNLLWAALIYRWCPPFGNRLFPGAAAELEMLAAAEALPASASSPEIRVAALNLLALTLLGISAGRALLLALLLAQPRRRPEVGALLVTLGAGGVVLFAGHFDPFYFPVTAAAVTAFGLALSRRSDRGRWWLLALCGLLLGVGTSLSLGFGAPAVLAGAVLLARPGRWRELSALAVGGLVAVAGFQLAGYPLLPAWLVCWRNHRAFFALRGLDYWPWMGWNAVDALLFGGVLVTVGAVALLTASGRARNALLGAGGMWLFLIFSGSARGEFGRLLILYVPVLLAGGAWLWSGSAGFRPSRWLTRVVIVALVFGALQVWYLRQTLKLVIID